MRQLSAAFFSAVGVMIASAASAQTADTVFTNGKVYTVDEAKPWAEAVAVSGNKIVYVGDNAGAEKLVGKARRKSISVER